MKALVKTELGTAGESAAHVIGLAAGGTFSIAWTACKAAWNPTDRKHGSHVWSAARAYKLGSWRSRSQ